MDEVEVSVIIPAFNEAPEIQDVIRQWKSTLAIYPHEIIVVDNGSTDQTLELSKKTADQSYFLPEVTISALRNFGARKSSGKILIFNDADVYPSVDWRKSFTNLMNPLTNSRMIIGGNLQNRTKSGFLYNHWFKYIIETASSDRKYVGSGHMLMSKATFNTLGGFDERLVTGEDYDICVRCQRSINGTIKHASELIIFHEGYPKAISGFIKREKWHGLGDSRSFSTAIRSRVAISSIIFITLLIISIISILSEHFRVTALSTICIALLLSITSFYKFRSPMGISGRISNIFITTIYLAARASSFIPFKFRPRKRITQ